MGLSVCWSPAAAIRFPSAAHRQGGIAAVGPDEDKNTDRAGWRELCSTRGMQGVA